MAHSLEARPVADHELAEYAMGLTDGELIRGGLKSVLRRAYADVLPEAVLNGKRGFEVPRSVGWKPNGASCCRMY